MAKYRHGFKSEASWYAAEMRRELGLVAHAPLCPWKLAGHLGYVVVELSAYRSAHPAEVRYLQSLEGRKEFSAITICGQTPLIIHNDAHGDRRQGSNIAHELAHGLLCHKPAALVGADGARIFDREQEDEANWLGPAILISDEAANHIARNIPDLAVARETYRVTEEVLNMRLRVSGALIRRQRRLARQQTAA